MECSSTLWANCWVPKAIHWRGSKKRHWQRWPFWDVDRWEIKTRWAFSIHLINTSPFPLSLLFFFFFNSSATFSPVLVCCGPVERPLSSTIRFNISSLHHRRIIHCELRHRFQRFDEDSALLFYWSLFFNYRRFFLVIFFCFDSFRIGEALKHCEWFFRHLWRCWWRLMILGDWLQVSFNSLRFLQITLTTCSRFLGLPLTLISILRDCWSFHCRFFVMIFCGSPFALNRQTQQSNALWVEIDLNSSTNLQRIVKEFPRRREAVALNCQTRQ